MEEKNIKQTEQACNVPSPKALHPIFVYESLPEGQHGSGVRPAANAQLD